MPERKKLFLKILKAELEDCLEDVEDLTNLYERRRDKEEITNYVFQENEALLSREFKGLKNIILSIDGLDSEGYASVEAFAAAVDVSPQGNPYWRNLPPGTNMLTVRQAFPPEIVAAFEAQGFVWGGKWAEFDLMHFEYRPELILLARLGRGENLPLADIRGLVRAVR